MKATFPNGITLEGTPQEIAPYLPTDIAEAHTQPIEWVGIDWGNQGKVYSNICPQGGYHTYPAVWMSISPPACSKCHQSAPALQPYIVQNTSGYLQTFTASSRFVHDSDPDPIPASNNLRTTAPSEP